MRAILWKSTRRTANGRSISFSSAVRAGLAPDGGLYVPERFPRFVAREFTKVAASDRLPGVAEALLTPFAAQDPLAAHLASACARAFDFPIQLRAPTGKKGRLFVLELFHGPTGAFKDFGARFLAESISALADPRASRTVLVATSGDTGGAVAAAFFGKPGIQVVILYPEGKISGRQEKQLTAWGGNVRAFAVQGDFDDCQRLAKEAFADPGANARHGWISANSINAGRLLPQVAYYVWASVRYLAETGREPSFVIPSGNLGNAMACIWARKMGFPIARIALATNANRAVASFLETGIYLPKTTVVTLANAMDVGAPSNYERLAAMYPDVDELRSFAVSVSVSDAEIRDAIAAGPRAYAQVWCPHTATAVVAAERLSIPDSVIVATAHPAKFESIVEPLIGREVPVPDSLKAILERPSQVVRIEAGLKSLLAHLG